MGGVALRKQRFLLRECIAFSEQLRRDREPVSGAPSGPRNDRVGRASKPVRHSSEGAKAGPTPFPDGQRILTPPISAGVLPGITRECILEVCAELDIDSAEESFTLDELFAAEEAFLTNSLMEVMPLTRVDGIPVGRGIPGRVTKSLMQAYRELVREETASSRMRDSHLFPSDDGAANGRRAGGGSR